ncbi:ABC transporter ATP-binding protein [Trujillonella humicola]|uniref:ABC transporter ATP-binding protein n=1 Tax=Trujillonella humicola TaxID=3383699 RepID=UPI003906400E
MRSSDGLSAVEPRSGPTAGPPVLGIERLRIRYEKLTAVHDVDLELSAGTISVLLGLNGAGKSSIMNAVAGVVPADAGRILLSGRDIGGLPAHRRARAGLAYLPEGRGVFPSLTVQQNLLLGSAGRSDDAHAMDTAFTLFPVLGERRKQAAGHLSGGEQQMLSLARCLAGRPTLLLLDEPSLGLAPRIVEELFATLHRLRDDGLTILMVEQFAHAALAVADTAGVLVRGELTRFGAAGDLRGLSAEELADLFFSETGRPAVAPTAEERAS